MTSLQPAARVSLAAVTIGLLLLILCGVFLVWIGIFGYEDYDVSRRVIALALGLACGIGMSALLILLLRQQVAGLPPVRSTMPGLAIGSTVIPWGEIDEISAVSMFALPQMAITQSAKSPKRLRGVRALQYMQMGDRRALFVSERQLATDLEAGIHEVQQAWANARGTAQARDPRDIPAN